MVRERVWRSAQRTVSAGVSVLTCTAMSTHCQVKCHSPNAKQVEEFQHEMLNWMALMGAMETLDRRPVVHDYVETHIFMSEKCFVSYPT